MDHNLYLSNWSPSYVEKGVKHMYFLLCCPASNGAAGRLVRIVKQALEAGHQTWVSMEHALTTFLLCNRVTPQATTGVQPSELMIGRSLHTRLDLIRPHIGRQVRDQQDCQKTPHDLHSRERGFVLGQQVWVRNMRECPGWIPGVIPGIQGPVSYQVRVASGALWRQHLDHIRDGTQHLNCTSAEK